MPNQTSSGGCSWRRTRESLYTTSSSRNNRRSWRNLWKRNCINSLKCHADGTALCFSRNLSRLCYAGHSRGLYFLFIFYCDPTSDDLTNLLSQSWNNLRQSRVNLKQISRRSLSKSNLTTQLYLTILLRLRNKYFPYNHEFRKIPSLQYCHASKLSYNFTIARFLPLFSYSTHMPLHQFLK